jgi:hypothetical protein
VWQERITVTGGPWLMGDRHRIRAQSGWFASKVELIEEDCLEKARLTPSERLPAPNL